MNWVRTGTMAIPYASGSTADHTPALPSIRVLIPPHLHDEIDSTSHSISRQHARERPTSAARELTSNSRLFNDRLAYGSTLKLPFAGDYSARTSEPQDRMAGNLTNLITGSPRDASRRPSPILPSIQNLQSLSERGMNTSGATSPESMALSRPELAAQKSKPGSTGPNAYPQSKIPGTVPGDRRSMESSLGNNGRMMPNQTAYPNPAMAHQSDSEQASLQSLSHVQQSDFGILGDSIDVKDKRRRGNLPKPATDTLRAWFHEHLDHPYPSEEDKQNFVTRTGLTISQISNWFINARRRQLPALRDQMRNGENDIDSQRRFP